MQTHGNCYIFTMTELSSVNSLHAELQLRTSDGTFRDFEVFRQILCLPTRFVNNLIPGKPEFGRAVEFVSLSRNVVAAKDLSLKYVLKDIPEIPYNAYLNHQHLIDMMRQHGSPHYWITVAPGAWTFPRHAWVAHQQSTCSRNRVRNGISLSWHMHHCLTELVGPSSRISICSFFG